MPTGNGAFAVETNLATGVTNGLFTTTIDFGSFVSEAIFSGPERWLEIAVRTNGAGQYIPLSPRQSFTATPYAITAANVISNGLSAGTYSNPFNFNNPGNSFSGNGGGLTNVSATTFGGLSTNAIWRTGGNAGTIAGPNFLGTTDNQPLELQVNGTRALRIEPHATSAPSLAGGYFQNSVAGFYGAVVAGGGTSAAANAASGNYAFIGAGYGANAGNNSAVIAGAYNSAPGNYGFIGTGLSHTNLANYSFIGSGANDAVALGSDFSVVAGGFFNRIQTNAPYSTIAGGADNLIQTNTAIATISGGHDNTIDSAPFSVIAGGGYNLIHSNAYDSAIGGGGYNIIAAEANSSVIAGGHANTIESNGFASSIGGGRGNLIQSGAFDSTIGGGPINSILSNANASTIGGGYLNVIEDSASFSAIGGGESNRVQSSATGSAILGGYYNLVGPGALFSFIGGGSQNGASAPYTTVSGGAGNTASAALATIAGGIGNNASAAYASVGGGGYNIASGDHATIPGGFDNIAFGQYSLAAGQQAKALHQGSFVWADSQNTDFLSTANDQFLVRAGGGVGINKNNPATALDVNGTITATAFSGLGGSLIGLNASQITSGTLADPRLSANVATLNNAQTFTGAKTFSAPTVFNNFVGVGTSSPIGSGSFIVSQNTSGFAGMYVNSGAAGRPFYGYAQGGTVAAYSYVDGSDTNKWKLFVSGAGDSVIVTTSGSVGVGTNNPQSLLHVNGESRWGKANILSTNQSGSIELGDSAQLNTTPFIDFHYGVQGSQDFNVRVINDASAQLDIFWAGSSTPMARLNPAGLTVNGAVVSSSDRNLKENFQDVNSRAVLEKVAALPVSTWNYKADTGSRHLGPMAQDFYAAFDIGVDDTHIATVDEGGVALAAIQGLNDKVESENALLREQLNREHSENAALKQRLDRLEKLMLNKDAN